jgi:hypothetical protein
VTDVSKFVARDDTQLVGGSAGLDDDDHEWPDGRPLTEASTAEYSAARKRKEPDHG